MGTNKPLPIPTSSSEITPDWVQLVTGHAVIQQGFKIEGDIQAGIGFMSSICRISYQTKSGESHHIIVKLLPTDAKFIEMDMHDLSDEREIKFYTIVFPDLLKVIPEIEENICVFYNGNVVAANPELGTKRQSMLVMEDLKALGFEMMDFSGTNSETVFQDLMTFFARLHFGGFSIEIEKGTSLSQLYPFMQGITDKDVWQSSLEKLGDVGFRQLEELLATQNIPSHVWTAYEKLKPLTASIIRKTYENGQKNPAKIHGDVWNPNVMVHDNLPVKILDWQLLSYRDVAYDLCFSLITISTKENLSKEYLRKWIRRYYDEFENLCKSHKNGDKIKRRSYEELEEAVFTWGAAFVYIMTFSFIECFEKDFPKYANVFRVLNDELHLPEFFEKACGTP